MCIRTCLVLGALLAIGIPCGFHDCGAAKPKPPKIAVTSPAFKNGGMIPSKYTCDGADVSPPISWTRIPKAAKSIALIADDPDAPHGTWVHWVIYNVPPGARGLPERVPPARTLSDGSKQGLNDFGKIGYNGPCPPGGTHRYFFKVYALDTLLKLNPVTTKAELVKAMNGHILAQGELMGKYARK